MKKKILVVEDDERITMSLTIRLRHEGYEVLTAEDAGQGMQRATADSPDLVVLDVMMPGGGGICMAENLRCLPETRTTPIIFITASRQAGLRDEAMAIPGAAVVEKPYDAIELVRRIENMLSCDPSPSPVSEGSPT